MAGHREAHRCWWLRGRWDVWRRGSAPLLLREGCRGKNSICDGRPSTGLPLARCQSESRTGWKKRCPGKRVNQSSEGSGEERRRMGKGHQAEGRQNKRDRCGERGT